MRLAFIFLKNVMNQNSFIETDSYTLLQGNAEELHFRLINLESFNEQWYLRFLPTSSATMEVQFKHLDSNKIITRPAIMAFPNDDRSIWKVNILSTDIIQPNSMIVRLTDNGVTYIVLANSELRMMSTDQNKYFC